MSDMSAKAKEALEKVKNKKRRVIKQKNSKGEEHTVYRRVSIQLPVSTQIDNHTTTPDLSLLAEARTNIQRITDGDTKIEELTYAQKQGVLYFLFRYLNYLSSAVLLKTKFMSTTMSFTLPDDLRLDAFQKQTIIGFNEDILKQSESLIFNVILHHCLYGTSFILCADNWNQLMQERLEEFDPEKDKEDNPVLFSLYNQLKDIQGLDIASMFKYYEKNPDSAYSVFKTAIDLDSDADYKKLVEMYEVDPDRLTNSEITQLRKKAFPLIDGLRFFEMGRTLNPAKYGNYLEENIDTGSFEIEIEKSDLLMSEAEFDICVKALDEFYTKYTINEETEEELKSDEEFIKDSHSLDRILKLNVSKLGFKGYSVSWVYAHLYPEADLRNADRIKVRNDSYQPLHIFRIKNQSLQEDLSNADSLIEAGIDLLNCELRQRSHINDTREKLVTVSINANAETELNAEVIDGIVEDLANAISSGESNVLSIPEGLTLEDQTQIIRASNDTEKLEMQAKTNIALFFGISTSMMEDSEAQFSNTFLKIDTAQNVFTVDREAISRMIEDKVLKPAAVKAGMFCKDKQGRTVVAYPRIKFNRISIGRASEDYNEIKELVDAGTLPVDMLYTYHNTSKEEVTSKLVENALSINNEAILTAMVNKLISLIDEDETGEILNKLLKGDTLGLMAKLKKTPEIVKQGEETGDKFVKDNPEGVSTPEYS